MRRFCTARVSSYVKRAPLLLPRGGRRWRSGAGTTADGGGEKEYIADSFESTAGSNAYAAMELAAEARREIHELWLSAETALEREKRVQQVAALIEKYKLDPSTPREADVSRGLGDAFDRLLLLCLPLGKTDAKGTDNLERLMHLAGRNGRELSVRTIQHLFARTDSFAEALAVFYTMRRCHVAMNMEAYYSMLYSLQRLEEEGWGQHFRNEYEENGAPSEQAMDFIVKGISNALLPENKPWLGRVMFQDRNVPDRRYDTRDFDELDTAWTQRYKSGTPAGAH
ncbi:hypothetical protein, conserved [Trypanosoma brucei gambiense DAL972]|uniref:Uncharacterized protein n=3 Tax=Trypanosoma brucei TaxID=5691 RepID=Q383D1_TRYB2|nr:hypothetical protein, conserved [Trypanosoma brucei gambiense DAL972]XP_829212.1 hypothetical protein, conserved [Trypanosoma brucei brucei TREU927]6HIV_DO Chain DO, ms62 [Trypanosoma brucei brucei]6HIW_DO Chain DO, mS62 [Trypanosoma brucei brucei]6HIY_DO Chain DO, mS62 [Trypanosoma brucei brucei]6SGA_DO Chain DO, mS62 (KRIPP14) [Trypanosoma brucei brucei]6SGB_DO Chain DO, mS62 (KRIPP14) [Trypanosoma brucei brucei]7PUA_DO Chain DO, mS62 [Trypanosoma brucei brucei]7PUB_DO Chain DO, mS62 [|eukprot:XP_011780431.1 hypothetical protein, conserved [Trypanosoma brucei gambiense DAL972]